MAASPENPMEGPEPVTEVGPGAGWLRITRWVLGVFGLIALFLGLFILFAGENQFVGLGGDLSWRVGDISPAWAYGMLAGGALLVLIVLATLVPRGGGDRS